MISKTNDRQEVQCRRISSSPHWDCEFREKQQEKVKDGNSSNMRKLQRNVFLQLLLMFIRHSTLMKSLCNIFKTLHSSLKGSPVRWVWTLQFLKREAMQARVSASFHVSTDRQLFSALDSYIFLFFFVGLSKVRISFRLSGFLSSANLKNVHEDKTDRPLTSLCSSFTLL